MVSTEDDEIRGIAEAWGGEVPFPRPEELATDTAGTVDVCLYTLARLAASGERYDLLACLLPTSPLRRAEDLRGAYETLVERDADA